MSRQYLPRGKPRRTSSQTGNNTQDAAARPPWMRYHSFCGSETARSIVGVVKIAEIIAWGYGPYGGQNGESNLSG
uniref:Uncharacterized protein n=1 Tax=Panagrellus redivivus TaxID=6233 RepID=A0A7E4V6B8_PANRE